MSKIKFNGEIAKKILKGIGTVGLGTIAVVAVMSSPTFGGKIVKEVFSWYEQQDRKKRFEIRKTFEQLRRERLIENKKLPDGSTILILSEKGKKYALHYDFDNLKLNSPKKWDGLWRLVIFDIPKAYSRGRNLFRFKLRALGLHQLQKSIWITPYPCREEIDFISEYLSLSPFIRLVEAKDFDGSEEIKKRFF